MLLGAIFSSFFIFNFMFYEDQLMRLADIRANMPVIFDRYAKIMLAFTFLKERILNSCDLSSFVTQNGPSPPDIDQFEKDTCLDNES